MDAWGTAVEEHGETICARCRTTLVTGSSSTRGSSQRPQERLGHAPRASTRPGGPIPRLHHGEQHQDDERPDEERKRVRERPTPSRDRAIYAKR
jgi:hypothetical protein